MGADDPVAVGRDGRRMGVPVKVVDGAKLSTGRTDGAESLSTGSPAPLVKSGLPWLTLDMEDENRDDRVVHRTGDLNAGGMGYDELRKAVRDGTMSKVRHGAVVDGPLQADLRERQLELIAGTAPALTGQPWVLSHTSAVALLGLPMTRDGAGSVWINRAPGTSSYSSPVLISRSVSIDDDEIVNLAGYRVTGPARTAVDMSR